MKKWMAAAVCCFLLLTGCAANKAEEPADQQKEGESVNPSANEMLLQAAAKRGQADKVAEWIREGADLNAQDDEGRTALMLATYNQDLETVKVLIEAGADVNKQDGMKNSPFLYAGAEGYLDILKLTIDAGADPAITNRYGGTALIPASEHGYVEVVKELLTRTTVDVNHVNNLGWTALLEAIILNNGNERQQQTVQLLIDHGADVNLADHDNVTPLQHARSKGFKEIERILLEAGAK
ncbi:ankyrin repeat domain-containing protein [Paenibacillus soyae]|uniref:Ankyrin repeat domain-containing protein n=1 Tax=Paenibacillus soyae TaxID=2969249 RepID=A0A9X2S9T4_9BACL|nr:ankyrin repeat domain-containing protein [Paenibacillus soyae]MCR2805491.1 ankyrin repeat domain-containing protein [Paenibacillus soyae]